MDEGASPRYTMGNRNFVKKGLYPKFAPSYTIHYLHSGRLQKITHCHSWIAKFEPNFCLNLYLGTLDVDWLDKVH